MTWISLKLIIFYSEALIYFLKFPGHSGQIAVMGNLDSPFLTPVSDKRTQGRSWWEGL